jgi:TRAP-type C4-dicarboxylate transport system permease small subunit
MSKTVYGVCRIMAWIGAIVLTALAAITVTSIIGRALSFAGLGPVPGDFELVEAGTALAVFCFLPWAHLKRSHATVDILWSAFPAATRRALDLLADVLMLVVWMLLVWRMGVGTLEYRANGELTFILQFPVWWGFAASMVPAVIGCVAYLWRVLETIGVVATPPGYAAEEGAH